MTPCTLLNTVNSRNPQSFTFSNGPLKEEFLTVQISETHFAFR